MRRSVTEITGTDEGLRVPNYFQSVLDRFEKSAWHKIGSGLEPVFFGKEFKPMNIIHYQPDNLQIELPSPFARLATTLRKEMDDEHTHHRLRLLNRFLGGIIFCSRICCW
jgi:hypothetical protein